MAREWKDMVVQNPRTFTIQNNPDGTVTLIPAYGEIIEPGTPVNAANLNALENDLSSHRADSMPHKTIAVRVISSANQSIPHGGYSPIVFSTKQYDTDDMHNISIEPTRLTVKKAGIYLIQANIQFASNGTGYRSIRIVVNRNHGANAIAQKDQAPASSTETTAMDISTTFQLQANDYVEVLASQTTGSSLDVRKTNYSPVFVMTGVGI